MAENPANSGAPARLENVRKWTPPENPLLKLQPADPGNQVELEPEDVGVEQEPLQEPEQQPRIKGDPYARNRILEKEKRRFQKEAEDAKKQLDTLMAAVSKKLAEEAEEETEEEPTNPLDALARGQERLLEELEEVKKFNEEKDKLTKEERATELANAQIRGFAQEAEKVAPGLYQNAMAYLANQKMIEFIDDNDATEDEAKDAVGAWVAKVKQKALDNGENPGEALFKRATLAGFNPKEFIAKASGGNKPATQSRPNPAEEIKKENKRKQGLASISGMQGVSAQDPLKGLSSLSEKERVRTIFKTMSETGDMRRRRPPTLAELLAHKEMR